MATGDMEIGDIMYENNKKRKNVATCQPPIILPTAARPLLDNPDDFVFEDIEEPEPKPEWYLNPTDDEDEDEDEDENMEDEEESDEESDEDLEEGDDEDYVSNHHPRQKKGGHFFPQNFEYGTSTS